MPEEEKKKLTSWKKKLNEDIKLQSRFWENTNQQEEKEFRHKVNNHNRTKLKIVENLLK